MPPLLQIRRVGLSTHFTAYLRKSAAAAKAKAAFRLSNDDDAGRGSLAREELLVAVTCEIGGLRPLAPMAIAAGGGSAFWCFLICTLRGLAGRADP